MILLNDRIYKGLHNGMDRVAYNLLVAKFQGSASAQSFINQYAIQDLQHKTKGVDLVVGIAPPETRVRPSYENYPKPSPHTTACLSCNS